MTEPDLPDPDDAVVSAYLDGESTPEEAARVEGDPALLARVERFRSVSETLSTAPAPAPTADAPVRAALEEFDRDRARELGVAGDDRSGVVELPPGPAQASWWRRIPPAAVAAAAIIVALVGAATLLDGRERGEDTATGVVDEATDGTGGDLEADAGMSSAGGERPEFGSLDELTDHFRGGAATGGARSGAGGGSDTEAADDVASPSAAEQGPTPQATTEDCDAVAAADIDPPTVERVEPVVLEGRPVTVVVHAGDGGRRLVVVDDGRCQVIADRSL